MFTGRCLRGIGLLELMLSLAIIGILLVMATRFFGVTHRSQIVNHATQDVAFVLAGLRHWQGDQGNYADLHFEALSAQGLVPDEMHADGSLPSWDGCASAKITVAPEGDHDGHALLRMTGLSTKLCQALAARFKTSQVGGVLNAACALRPGRCQGALELLVD